MSSALEYSMKYDAVPLSKRISMKGTSGQTRAVAEDLSSSAFSPIDPDTGHTPLINAAIEGKAQLVRVLIDRGADLEYGEPKHSRTALMLACRAGQAQTTDEILRRGAVLDRGDKYDMTALVHASKAGNANCVDLLIKRGANLNHVDNNGNTAVHFAAKYGHKECVRLLADAGASLEVRDAVDGRTPLMLAAQFGRKDTVELLLDKGAIVNRKSTFEKTTALMLASKEGHKSTVSLLIARDADADMVDIHGWAALHFAASWGRRDTAQILIVEGRADVNSREDTKEGVGGTPPLVIAAKGQQVAVMQVLLNYGCDINLPEMVYGKTALMAAAGSGDIAVIQCLLDYQVDINARNHMNGMTALMYAAENGQRPSLIMLLDYLADINILNHDGIGALDYANRTGHRDTLLSAIMDVTPAAKVNLLPWVEMELPNMVRGSLCGGPSVFLNNFLYTYKGLYSGLLKLSADCDVYIVYCFVMIAAMSKKCWHRHKKDRPELARIVQESEALLAKFIQSKGFCIDWTLTDAFILGKNSYQSLGSEHKAKYFASAFHSGPLALYADNDLSQWLETPQLKERIDAVFYCNIRDKGHSVNGYGTLTTLLRLRYSPFAMVIAEGLSKAFLLAIVITNCSIVLDPNAFYERKGGNSKGFNFYEAIIIIMLIFSLVYEIGLMEEKRWAVSPSIVFDYKDLERRRWYNVLTHFISTVWSFLDFLTYGFIAAWLILKGLSISNGSGETSDQYLLEATGNKFLVTAAIPISIGLLRYLSAFNEWFGVLMLTIFYVVQSLWGFLVVFVMTGLGFGVVLYSIYRNELPEFRSVSECTRVLFDGVVSFYDSNTFVSSGNYSFGTGLSVLFLLWTTIILMNLIIAFIVFNFKSIHELSKTNYQLWRVKLIQQHGVSLEKSALAMLPPPLNAATTVVYPIHVYLSWRARLYPKEYYSLSLAGAISDDILIVFALLPTACYEYLYNSLSSEETTVLYKALALLFCPLGILYACLCLLVKVYFDETPKVVIKSRLSDGRLRLSLGRDRDVIEALTLANFEDDRIHKNLEYFVNVDNVSDDHSQDNYSRVGSKKYEENNERKRPSSKFGIVSFNFINQSSKRFADTKGSTKRITPASPFLQLANVSNVDEVKATLSEKFDSPSIRTNKSVGHPNISVATSNGGMYSPSMKSSIKLAGRLSPKKSAKFLSPEGTEINQPLHNNNATATTINGLPVDNLGGSNSYALVNYDQSSQALTKPELLYEDDGSISLYQPGFTNLDDQTKFSVKADREEVANKSLTEEDKQQLRLLNYRSLYFVANKFSAVLSQWERNELFKIVLPELFLDDYARTARDNEKILIKILDRINTVEKKQSQDSIYGYSGYQY